MSDSGASTACYSQAQETGVATQARSVGVTDQAAHSNEVPESTRELWDEDFLQQPSWAISKRYENLFYIYNRHHLDLGFIKYSEPTSCKMIEISVILRVSAIQWCLLREIPLQ